MKKNVICALLLAALSAVPLGAADNLNRLNVYPNPVRRAIGQSTLTFDNVTSNLKLRIFTPTGTLVRQIEVSGGGNSYVWDLKNQSGQEVASGIYVFVLTNPAGEKRTGKVAVIR